MVSLDRGRTFGSHACRWSVAGLPPRSGHCGVVRKCVADAGKRPARGTSKRRSQPGRSTSAEVGKDSSLIDGASPGEKIAHRITDSGNCGAAKTDCEESEFLETCGRQLGIAIENFRLLEQVLRSQRQWRNTFDSVHDIILAHDAEFRIIKANQILLEQLEQSSADVIGSTCESVLPHTLGE